MLYTASRTPINRGTRRRAEADAEDVEASARRFRFHLVSADGSVVGVYECATPISRGDVVTLDGVDGSWRVLSTLGHVASVELLPERLRAIRVSVSRADAASSLAEELGGDAKALHTPHGWIVSLPLAGDSRIAALARVAAASRSVVAAYPDAELFVLDGERPVRIPPPL